MKRVTLHYYIFTLSFSSDDDNWLKVLVSYMRAITM